MKWQSVLVVILFLGVVYLPLFLHLDSLSVRYWDESINAVNALEMSENHEWLIRYFDGKPDLWHTKPPLLTWAQVLSMRVVGYNELGLRLPVALAAALTALLLLFFARRTFGEWEAGFFGGMVLVTIPGYVGHHVARTGDVDGLLVLFVTLFCLAFFKYLHGDPARKKTYLAWAAAGFALAILSKGAAALLVVPGMLLYLFQAKKVKSVLRDPSLYLAALVALSVPLLYYLLREWQSPGYLSVIWENELGGRFLSTKEGHLHPFNWYFENLWRERLAYWVYLLVPLVLLAYRHPSELARKFCTYGIFFSLSYLLVISASRTKLEWYDAPLFPILALAAGIGLSRLWQIIRQEFQPAGQARAGLAMLIFAFGVFALPYKVILHKNVSHPRSLPENERIGYYVKELQSRMPDLKRYTIAFYGFPSLPMTYEKMMERNPGYDIAVKHHADDRYDNGEIVLVCLDSTYFRIQQAYQVTVLDTSDYFCRQIRIEGKMEE